MSDMRLVVAGAGGRMGRTLIKAIAETPGLALSGALEDAKSPLIGQDSGQLSGLGNNGIALTTDGKDLIAKADGVIDFTVPKASVALAIRPTRKPRSRTRPRARSLSSPAT